MPIKAPVPNFRNGGVEPVPHLRDRYRIFYILVGEKIYQQFYFQLIEIYIA